MIYTDQLKKPNWQRRRLQIFERDGFACTQCGDTENELQVHHKIYFPGVEAWEYHDSDLITLCKRCHTKENKREKHELYLLHSLKQGGFTAYEIYALSSFVEKYDGFRHELRNMIIIAIESGL